MKKLNIGIIGALIFFVMISLVASDPTIDLLDNKTTPYTYEQNVSSGNSSNVSIEYGLATTLGSVEGVSANNTNQTVTLRGLHPGNTYYFNVTMCYNASMCNTTGPFSFATDDRSQYPTANLDGGGVFNLKNWQSVSLGSGGLPFDNITSWAADPGDDSYCLYDINAGEMLFNHMVEQGGDNLTGLYNFTNGSIGGDSWSIDNSGGTVGGVVLSDETMQTGNVTITNEWINISKDIPNSGKPAAWFGNGDGNSYVSIQRGYQSTTGSQMRIYRNYNSTLTNAMMVYMWNDNANDDQEVLRIRNDGNGEGLNIQDMPNNKSIIQQMGDYHCLNGDSCTRNISSKEINIDGTTINSSGIYFN